MSVKSQILLAGKKGDSVFIGIPTSIDVKVTNGLNNVQEARGTAIKDGVEYNIFAIVTDFRYTKFAEFNTFINGKCESHKVDIVNRKLI